jgi:hypothetical protein
MMPKTETLVNSSKALTRRLAVQPQKASPEAGSSLGSPAEKKIRNSSAGKLSPHRDSVNIRRFIRRCVWPEKRIRKLELYRSGHLRVALRQVKLAPSDIGSDTLGNQFIVAPHWDAPLPKPLCRLDKNARNRTGVAWAGLSNDEHITLESQRSR